MALPDGRDLIRHLIAYPIHQPVLLMNFLKDPHFLICDSCSVIPSAHTKSRTDTTRNIEPPHLPANVNLRNNSRLQQ